MPAFAGMTIKISYPSATPLYDSERFRQAIEAAYEKMLG